MKIVVTFDGRTYTGANASEVVALLMKQSHDQTTDPLVYKMAVARRARVALGTIRGRIRVRNDWDFLRDLDGIGQLGVIKKILSP
jgi:hypothetical protein